MGSRGSVFEGTTLFIVVVGAVATLLVWCLMAAPAFAQATAGDVDLQSVDCSQVQAAVAGQYNSGDAVAGTVAQQYSSGDATAGIAQALGIDQSQVNACLSGSDAADDKTGDVNSDNDVLASTISDKGLPNTGGAPLPGAVLGFALVAAGILSVGLIVRRGR